MSRPLVVLTVCLGNICRSPTAEAALIEAASERGLPLEVRSAGTGSWHIGQPPDARMLAAASDVGLRLRGTAAQVVADDLEEADLVLAMDTSNLNDLERIAEASGTTTPIFRFREFDPEANDDLDVPDPYYGGTQGFVDVVEMCRRAAREVVAWLADGGLAEAREQAATDRAPDAGRESA